MTEIVALLHTIAPLLRKTTLGQLCQVVFEVLATSGRITMLGLSRWTEKGGSYRTIQRLYHTLLPWNAIHWQFFRQRFLQPEGECFIDGDEGVVSKAGKETYGLDRFFSGLQQQVIILKTNLVTHAQAHAILFSTDLAQAYDHIIRLYSLRFQIEFHFRDAKQYWGLEDFMIDKATAITNAANLAFFMVNVSQALLKPFRQHQPDYSILDLKSHYRGYRYARETIKLLPQKPDAHLLAHIFAQIARLGAIHSLSQHSPTP